MGQIDGQKRDGWITVLLNVSYHKAGSIINKYATSYVWCLTVHIHCMYAYNHSPHSLHHQSALYILYIIYTIYLPSVLDTAVGRQAHAYTACIVLVTLCNKYWQIDCHYIFCILVWSCLQCFDTVGWAAGRASSL